MGSTLTVTRTLPASTTAVIESVVATKGYGVGFDGLFRCDVLERTKAPLMRRLSALPFVMPPAGIEPAHAV
jgi:hypothetical protein